MNPQTPELALVFAQLSLVAIGGINAILPELQRQVVQHHGWMTAPEFAALFAIAQAAPGPNMLVSTLIGWHVAGIQGAIAATLGLIAPCGLLTYAIAHAWHRFRDRPWRRLVQAALLPVTAGMVMAAALLICRDTSTTPAHAALTLVGTALLLRTSLHPLWLLAAGAGLGAAGIL